MNLWRTKMDTKPRLLCILHRTPPAHGAAKVGDFIAASKEVEKNFDCRYITIRSSKTIGDIGKVNLKKLYYVTELYVKVLWMLLIFQPHKVYYTASIKSVAFYRDLLVSTLWKTYKILKPVDVYYHYHTKGIDDFVSVSKRNLILTRFFLKDTNLILLSPMLENDFKKVQTYKKVYFLPNAVEDPFENIDFYSFINSKFQKKSEKIEVLYLSNMIKSKGYFRILKLANKTKEQAVHYHFAGSWQNSGDEKEFFEYIEQNGLVGKVTFHGFVNGKEKDSLFKKAHLLLFPTRYKAETFGLVIIEAFSYGLPVIATDEGSIPCILNEESGILLDNVQKLPNAFEKVKEKLINVDSAKYCRNHYLKYFTLVKFEDGLVKILKGG